MMASRFPFPTEKGDKLRMFHHIEQLSLNHKVVLIALHEEPINAEKLQPVQALCSSIHLLAIPRWRGLYNGVRGWINGLPFQVAYFYQRKLKDKIHTIILQENPDVIFSQLIRTVLYTRNLPFYKVLDYMDCFSLICERSAKQSRFLEKWFWTMEGRRIAALEKDVFYDFDQRMIISEFDRQNMPVNSPQKITVVQNGVNFNYFYPSGSNLSSYSLVFAGNMGYRPNIRAAKYLIEQLLPRLPEVQLLIAGARPAKYLIKNKNPQVLVSGWMADIRKAYWSAEIFIAPIFEGGGMQNKVLEAMACGKPCIISTIVNNGIGAEDGKEVLIANDVDTFVHYIKQLLADQTLKAQLGHNARKFICENYSWHKQHETIENLINHDLEYNRNKY